MNYEQLKNTVLKHSHSYYDSSVSVISDAEWDKLYEKLEAVEQAQGWRDSDSPTLKVGGKAGKVKHPFKLYSLRKEYDLEAIDEDFDIITPKIDGANLSLIYKRGKLKLALTRGDGEMGENVTHLATEISNIPIKIDTEIELLVVNGECLTDKPVENYRNYVSGALGLKSAKEFKEREIIFVAHDSLGFEINYTNRMAVLSNMGFFTVLDEKAKDYPQDGIVYRINDFKKCIKLGYTSKYPRFAIALKEREAETAITTLQDVVWVIGRTGTVNPTGIIDPVTLDDATISRVTLHNLGIIEQHSLGLGDTIEIERAGGVIPKFLRVIEHSKHGLKINQNHAEKAVGTDTRKDGPRLLVKDKSNINTAKVLEHFIKTIDIKGLGPANVKKMGLTHPVDLFNDNNWDKLGAIGPNIEAEIDRAKTKPYELVLASLGINGVGKRASKLIVSKIPTFKRLRDIATIDIKGVGPSTIDSILSWLDENEDWVHTLPLKLEQNVTVEDIIGTESRKICITGKLDMARTELGSILETKGFKVTSTVTKDCYALITAGDNSSSKFKKANTLGVKIVDYWSSKKEVLVGNF
jgi:DNA ligase (NAD+)|tara:strand:- start:10299 stop:12038 length:1740 start_codon:yes stop_codon:yes gene_type:complete